VPREGSAPPPGQPDPGQPDPGQPDPGEPDPGEPAGPPGRSGPTAGQPGRPAGQSAYDDAGISEAEMLEVARELAATPVEDVVANHCYGLFELAALHLSQSPPNLEAARLSIDAMGCIVDGLGGRLGSHAATLSEGLNQLRLAFVRIAEAGGGRETNGAVAGEPS
jgi:hypothetical protein